MDEKDFHRKIIGHELGQYNDEELAGLGEAAVEEKIGMILAGRKVHWKTTQLIQLVIEEQRRRKE